MEFIRTRVVIAVLVWCTHKAALAAPISVTISSVVDGTISRSSSSGPFTTLDTTATSIELLRARSLGAFEFDIHTLPVNAAITEAHLQLFINTIQGPTLQTADFHGYAGDGSITLSDATVPQNVVAQFAGNDVGINLISVNPLFLTSVRAASQYAGFLAVFTTQDPGSSQLRFSSSEFPFFDSDHPMLEVTYTVPEPPSSAIAVAALLIAMFAGRCRRCTLAPHCERY